MLGTVDATITDELSEKLQTAFDPYHPIRTFAKIHPFWVRHLSFRTHSVFVRVSIYLFSKTSFVLLQEILAWKGRRRGSTGELEVDNVDMIEVLEEDDEVMVLEEHSEGVEEGSDKLSRTESNKSFNSLGEEVSYWPFLK